MIKLVIEYSVQLPTFIFDEAGEVVESISWHKYTDEITVREHWRETLEHWKMFHPEAEINKTSLRHINDE